jgi:Rieske Fe-S protein
MPSHFEDRRRALARFVTIGMGAIGAGLASLVALVAAPKSGGVGRRWRAAASIFDLPPSGPYTAILAERHADGWHATRRQNVVYIDKDDDSYRALSATCTHLGCRVRWDEAKTQYRCPCHGGVFDRAGNVVAGPPPSGLTRLNVRVNPQTSEIEVEL